MGNIPASERTRAEEMLHAVATEIGFGPFQDPKRLIVLTAQRLGGNWGLNGKRGDPHNISGDILAYRIPGAQPQLVDVLIDSGGDNGLSWSELEYPQPAGAIWIDPNSQTAPEVPPPVPAPEPSAEPGEWTGASDDGTMPAIPSGMHPDAYRVGTAVYNEMRQKLGRIPKGTEDGGDLPEAASEGVRRMVAGVAAVVTDFAIGISQSGTTSRTVSEGEREGLENTFGRMAPKLPRK